MKNLLSSDGLDALYRDLQGRALLAFDFDGTLAPIVKNPSDAFMAKAVAIKFKELCTRTSVAVITGRNVVDVMKRIESKPKYVIGNHGTEGLPGIADQELEYLINTCHSWQRQLSEFGINEIEIPGLFTEKNFIRSVYITGMLQKKLDF